MTDLPHVIAGQPLPLSEEHIRVFEAYCREHNIPLSGGMATAAKVNAAVDWWNALGPGDERTEAIATDTEPLRPFLKAALDRAAPEILKQMKAAVSAAAGDRELTTLPHGAFTLHSNDTTRGPDNEPTLYVICSCGRGYAYGHRATSADLFAFLVDHDWVEPAEAAK